jgi:hypothetical protein
VLFFPGVNGTCVGVHFLVPDVEGPERPQHVSNYNDSLGVVILNKLHGDIPSNDQGKDLYILILFYILENC